MMSGTDCEKSSISGVLSALEKVCATGKRSQQQALAMLQLLKISKDQKVAAMIAVPKSDANSSLLLLTKNGWMKQVTMSTLSSSFRRPGLSAIKLVSPQPFPSISQARASKRQASRGSA